jgi:AbrB family looped-hinge helix DNA binding protein
VIKKMFCKTKVSGRFQTVVPAEMRKEFNIKPGTIMEWRTTPEGVMVEFREEVAFEDVYGMVKGVKTNAVEAKKRIQRGEKY